ncbi:hypothetical protein AYO44_10265 [Planctomycetaceae bacterium SCGC AG-212-F19]|nr:hypothetical protein AYO44_10265 [Planctomycetaceae bacterium SCGC AG-212-F19]
MRYIIGILLPPLGLLMCGKIFQALFCTILLVVTLAHAWPIGSIWAVLVAFNWYAEKRNEQLVREMRRGG